MIGDTISLTYNTVAKVLSKVNQDNFGAEYFLDDGTNRFTCTVKHTIPQRGKAGESHLVRLDVEHYDGAGVLERVSSAWTVVRTDVGIQDQTLSEYASDALVGWATPANMALVIARQS